MAKTLVKYLPQYALVLHHWRFFRRLRLVRLREVALVLGFGTMTVLAEVGGMSMILPILEFIEHGREIETFQKSSHFGAAIVKIYGFVGLPVTLFTLSFVAFLCVFARQLINFFNAIEIERIKWNVARRLSIRVFSQIIGSHATNIRSYKASDFGVTVGYECNAAAAIPRVYGTMWTQVLNFVMYGSVLIWNAPTASLLAGAIILFSMACLRFLIKSTRRLSVTSLGIRHAYMAFLNERFRAWRLIKLGDALAMETRNADDLQAKIVQNQIDVLRASGAIMLIFVPAITAFLLGVMYVFVEILHLGFSTIALFVVVMLRLVPVNQALQKQWILLAQYSPSLDRVEQKLDEATRAAEKIDVGRVLTAMSEGIRFENVSFRYPERDVFALRDISVTIPAGKMTALVGASGAGKSTLVDLIPRLIDPTEGRILIDGMPVRDISLRSLRRLIAYVPQEPFIFDAPIVDNIRYPRPDATDDEVAEAARLANAFEFIIRTQNGFATMLGEAGAKLSGGQKQRIVLARAFLSNAPIIVLDEPTSALDSESESAIQRSLEEMVRKRGRTVLIIAHRLSTLRNADFVIHLDHGRLLNTGSAAEILQPLEAANADLGMVGGTKGSA